MNPAAEPAAAERGPRREGSALVLRNAAMFLGAQALVTPLTTLASIVSVRYLGPDDLGLLYLASTFVGLAVLVAEWGQSAALTAAVASDRSRSGEWLGSGLALRVVGCLLVAPLLWVSVAFRGDGYEFGVVVALAFAAAALTTLAAGCQDTIRGLERVEFSAGSFVAFQLVSTAVTLTVLFLGGKVQALLLAGVACSALGLVVVLAALRPLGVSHLAARLPTMRNLAHAGTPFVVFGVVIALQPSVDAVFLSRYASTESVGWYAAARRILNPLVYPAGALVAALYPTLCRLHSESKEDFIRTARGAVANVSIVALPAALGCFLFPDIPTLIFGRDRFAGAEADIRTFSVFVFLVYFSMPLGSCIVASGKKVPWTVVQIGSVLVSALFDPVLIPWFQTRTGNGGLAVCVTAGVSEILMLSGAVYLAPRGMFDRAFGMKMAGLAISGGAMAGAAFALARFGSVVAAPLTVVVYVACAMTTGALGRAELAALRGIIRR